MNKFKIAFFILFIGTNCLASPFDIDTLDNWQIYSGDSLILSGHENYQPTTSLRFSQLKQLRIQYNNDTHSTTRKIAIWILIPADKPFGIQKEFTGNPKGEYLIAIDPLRTIPVKRRRSVKIWYGVNKKTLGKCLGEIYFID